MYMIFNGRVPLKRFGARTVIYSRVRGFLPFLAKRSIRAARHVSFGGSAINIHNECCAVLYTHIFCERTEKSAPRKVSFRKLH